jgi:hypothetical protein
MNRRELLKHTALLIGTSLSPAIIAGVTSAIELHGGSNNSRLSGHQRDLIAVLSERIIPTTDTPGAIEAKVPEFIDLIVSEWQTEMERATFLEGLGAIDRYCSKHYQQSFLKCTENQQIAALTVFSENVTVEKTQADDPLFFMALRELVVVGYFTSKTGATQALRHSHAPGAFIGDYPLKDVGKAWSPFY